MTAFESAWEIAKMPLDYDSINRVATLGSGKRYVADFIHPDTEQIYPMVTEDFGQGYEGAIYESEIPEHFDEGEHGKRGSLSHLIMTHGSPAYAWGVKTDRPHRRKGMAAALYDLTANILDREGVKIEPSYDRSRDGKSLWSRYDDEGFWPRSAEEKEKFDEDRQRKEHHRRRAYRRRKFPRLDRR
tara:strand:- start:10316 stop:10873 length:558 start_codon:yes stop_codon:yes gene_type:complete